MEALLHSNGSLNHWPVAVGSASGPPPSSKMRDRTESSDPLIT